MEGNIDLGQVFTSGKVADYMVSLIDVPHDSKILEPCFGDGAFLSALKRAKYSNVTGVEIDASLYSICHDAYPDFKLFNSDFLSFSQTADFDAVIMNPPYIRHEKINDMSSLGITKKKLLSEPLFTFLPKAANIYMYFVVKALNCLRRGGELIVIFPSTWENSKTGKDFKKYLDENYTVTDRISVKGEIFSENALVDVIILKVINRKPAKSTTNFISLSLEEGRFSTLCDDCADYEMHIDSLSINFKTYAEVRRGITTGYNQFFLNPPFTDDRSKKYTEKIISKPRFIGGYSISDQAIDSLFVPDASCLNNDETKEYIGVVKEKIVRDKKPKALYERIIRDDAEWFLLNTFKYPSIIFNYFVRNRMRFIDNSNGDIVKDNFYVIKPKIDYYLLFALLNNRYTYCQLYNSGKNYGGEMLKIQKYDIEDLKFPDISQFSSDDIRKLRDLAKKLISTGSDEYVEAITSKITSIINPKEYTQINYSMTNLTQQRLEYV